MLSISQLCSKFENDNAFEIFIKVLSFPFKLEVKNENNNENNNNENNINLLLFDW